MPSLPAFCNPNRTTESPGELSKLPVPRPYPRPTESNSQGEAEALGHVSYSQVIATCSPGREPVLFLGLVLFCWWGQHCSMAGVSAGLPEKEAEGSPEPQNFSGNTKSRKLPHCQDYSATKVGSLGPWDLTPAPTCPSPTSIWPNSLVVEETDFPMSTKERWMGFLVW